MLDFLINHQDAGDTIDGIIDWWLVEQQIKHQTKAVKEALAELVKNQLIIERKGMDSRSHYRINRDKEAEIQALLNPESS